VVYSPSNADGSAPEREIPDMTMTYLKDFVALGVFFTAGYVWLVIA
jgi:hypothetical protein